MAEIKPKMVDGEARCDGRECYYCDSVVRALRDGGLCAPFYRACAKRLTGVIDRQVCEIERLRKNLAAAAKMCAKHVTAYFRAEAVEAERDRLAAERNAARWELCETIAEWESDGGDYVDPMQVAIRRGWPELCPDWSEIGDNDAALAGSEERKR